MAPQDHRAQRRDGQSDGLLPPVGRDSLHGDGAVGADAAAAPADIVRVEDLLIIRMVRHAEAVVFPRHRREVHRADQLVPPPVAAQEHQHVVVIIVGHQPLKALPAAVVLPQAAVPAVQPVQLADALVGAAAGGVVQQIPVQLALKRPLVPLAQLRAHEQQLLSRVAQHVGVESPHARQLPPVVAGHLAPQGAFHVYYLVVGQGQHVVLGKGVDHGEGHVLVVELAEIGVHLQIVAQVVHPAHVPLQVEAQSPCSGGYVTSGQAVDSSATIRALPSTAKAVRFSARRNSMASRFSRPPWQLGRHAPPCRS